ncbi:hypothetical protein B0A48_13432 [Cryoendolithus antarcticus]|uniref:sterol 3beta-glucosyltransferase n=1 Tax=Cryoendolithus antarcticus TaxID=1507870 RepID=A0A1V8SQ19_9PEZI|nr:hypothetical protein B0A48_13432 [Cryoendolithus antarcticus]
MSQSITLPDRRSASAARLQQGRRKLVKKRYDRSPGMAQSSIALPARFDEVDEEEENAARRADEAVAQSSVYGLFAQARRDGTGFGLAGRGSRQSVDGGRGSMDERRANVDEAEEEETVKVEEKKSESKGHRKRFSETRLQRGLLKPMRERSDSTPQDMTQSQILPPKGELASLPERRASTDEQVDGGDIVLDRKLQAQAKAEMEDSASTIAGRSRASTRTRDAKAVLAEIFHFDEPEEVVAQYPCFYVQTVLLHGDFYITTKHICFYAYLPRKDSIVKSGNISKKGKNDPRYVRRWFVLKGDVLNYYKDAAHPYEPVNGINLRYAITAELTPEKGKGKETPYFTIVTPDRTYYLRADSATSAKEWVKQLQKVIFRSHNDGDSVKISLPISNIVEVESNPIVGNHDTVNLHVIDNNEDFAIDEYLFTFTTHGQAALSILNEVTRDNESRLMMEGSDDEVQPTSHLQTPGIRRSLSIGRSRSPRMLHLQPGNVQEQVRSTLSPIGTSTNSPRASGEYSRKSLDVSRASLDRGRSSFDRGRRSGEHSRTDTVESRRMSKSPLAPTSKSSDSFATTSEKQSGSSSGRGEPGPDMSASQILTGDDAFRAPTMGKPQPKRTLSGSTIERLRRASRDMSRESSVAHSDRVKIHPPSRAQTDQTLSDSHSSVSGGMATRASQIAGEDDAAMRASDATIAPGASRPIATPLHHAATLAGYVRDTGKRMGSYLSSSPGIYYEKVTGAMAGGKRHYSEAEALSPEDRIPDPEDSLADAEDERRFQQHFSLTESERLMATWYCSLHRVLPLYGKVYLGTRYICYRSLLPGTRTKIVIPLRDIFNVEKQKSYRIGYPGMILVIKGHEELFFDFGSVNLRDDCVVSILRGLDLVAKMEQSTILTDEEKLDADAAANENELLSAARRHDYTKTELLPADIEDDGPPILFDDGSASVLSFKPKDPLKITCLTIGSRGDVQPYIALCKGLLEEGHKPRIATHREFQGWVEKHDIEFAPVEGDPAELMKLCVEHGMFTPKFITETNSKFRGWLDELLDSAWKACQGSDVLIESPSAMAGIHIAEALGIPYFRAFTMPWTRTRAYPHAFASLNSKAGGAYNWTSYVVFENVFWHMTAGQMNKWRHETLGLRSTDLKRLQQNKRPFLYNFSPSVVVPPLDFSDWVRVTGYWFLDEANSWTPPSDLLAFINKAKADNAKLVYIGFGSIVVSDSRAMTQHIVDAVLKADVRCILSKGWSDRLDGEDAHTTEVPLPSSIFQISSAPHDWLFKQIDAAVHHGGAGTTGASLRAGIPTVIKPFFGDQFFFATRVEDIGVGLRVKHITPNSLGRALWIATHDDRMRNKARVLGEQIRAEDGVQTAIKAIYRDMEYARSLIRPVKGQKQASQSDVSSTGDATQDSGDEEGEESWTFVESESEADAVGHRGNTVGSPGSWEQHALQRRFGGFAKPALGSVVLGRGKLLG